MTSLTRDEFLNYVHTPLVYPGDPPDGSPTKSATRYRWRELHHWDVEADAMAYWDTLTDKDVTLEVDPAHWRVVQTQLRSFNQPLTSEPTLRVPFSNAYHTPHNIAIQGASDVHAQIWTEGSYLENPPIGNADFLFVYDGKLVGVIELKTWWKVTEAQIEDVRAGTCIRNVWLMGRSRTVERNSSWTSCY